MEDNARLYDIALFPEITVLLVSKRYRISVLKTSFHYLNIIQDNILESKIKGGRGGGSDSPYGKNGIFIKATHFALIIRKNHQLHCTGEMFPNVDSPSRPLRDEIFCILQRDV